MIEDRRPNPDELLSRIKEEEARARRGKLKIFSAPRPASARPTPCCWLPASCVNKAKVRLLLQDDGDRLQSPPVQSGKPRVDLAIAQWRFDRNDPAGLGTDTLPAASLLYLPLKAPLRTRGVLAVAPEQRRLLMIPEQRRLLDTFAALIAIALERVHFAVIARDTLVKMEAERQRNSLLAALSYDLRTPLTGLIGLASLLTG